MESLSSRLAAYRKQLKILLTSVENGQALYQTIVDAPFSDPLMATNLKLGFMILLLVDKDGKTIKRVAFSNTEHAANSLKTSEKSFLQIEIALNHNRNIIAKAVRSGKQQRTEDWDYLFTPTLSASSARFDQATAGIAFSIVQPFRCKPHNGAFVWSFYEHMHEPDKLSGFMQSYAKLVEQALKQQKVK